MGDQPWLPGFERVRAPVSDETRARMRAAAAARWTPEARAAASAMFKGRVPTAEARANNAAAQRRRYAGPGGPIGPGHESVEYRAWSDAKRRCVNPKDRNYFNYGGRGISMCDEWKASFVAFFLHIGLRPSPDLSLDRVDNSGNYEPGNVRWATRAQQMANRRPECEAARAKRKAGAVLRGCITPQERERRRKAATAARADEVRAWRSERAKAMNAARGPVSAETRAKLSAASKGRPQSAEARAKRSASMTGRKASVETRARLVIAWKRRRGELVDEVR